MASEAVNEEQKIQGTHKAVGRTPSENGDYFGTVMKKAEPRTSFLDSPPTPHASTTLQSPSTEVITGLDELISVLDHARNLAYAATGSSSNVSVKLRVNSRGAVKSITVDW